ncbi:phosphatidylserine decarboxylase [Anaerosporobacter mobilis DSM 15930]|jgi:phosphatidylserine decarboxylase|uniref:Phosphatidylserine decarboxylase n=1 Tax=Anaerosporobacter mobilis DSM 15930 TaxID=1120996 RepID=A0A1M7ETZ8_9FIRM|nr:phosphatidylserine decarboxylase [Anaerosporobacter mobilis]SHL94959.1 phosphatidylserine decarboxylase [Anaerosporobacter mobilis DSM 15930]
MKYIDLEGNKVEKETKQDLLLREIYTSPVGRGIMKLFVNPIISKVGGLVLNSRLSTLLIPSFIKNNGIDLEDYVDQYYNSYNEFFMRQIKKEKRPIDDSEDTIISPSDGKVSVYQVSDKLVVTIKNSNYTVTSLLRNKELAKQYRGGYLVIVRLTVDDYHRYCYPVDGCKGKNIHIKGILHTVNPIANDYVKIYKENSREYTVIKTQKFGDIIQMEVGALMVGKISNYHQELEVTKGQEKGRFEFGGSSIVLLLDSHKVKIDNELLINTKSGYETMMRMGQVIGYVNNNK